MKGKTGWERTRTKTASKNDRLRDHERPTQSIMITNDDYTIHHKPLPFECLYNFPFLDLWIWCQPVHHLLDSPSRHILSVAPGSNFILFSTSSSTLRLLLFLAFLSFISSLFAIFILILHIFCSPTFSASIYYIQPLTGHSPPQISPKWSSFHSSARFIYTLKTLPSLSLLSLKGFWDTTLQGSIRRGLSKMFYLGFKNFLFDILILYFLFSFSSSFYLLAPLPTALPTFPNIWPNERGRVSHSHCTYIQGNNLYIVYSILSYLCFGPGFSYSVYFSSLLWLDQPEHWRLDTPFLMLVGLFLETETYIHHWITWGFGGKKMIKKGKKEGKGEGVGGNGAE